MSELKPCPNTKCDKREGPFVAYEPGKTALFCPCGVRSPWVDNTGQLFEANRRGRDAAWNALPRAAAPAKPETDAALLGWALDEGGWWMSPDATNTDAEMPRAWLMIGHFDRRLHFDYADEAQALPLTAEARAAIQAHYREESEGS